ncbi:acyl-CoA dehydrogenase family protein [Streptomyces sp. NPDC048291]|uniref:acyl-CoA dehydrogenase family protein n=1 Tax=Streptomyces sp. NPDC048291 TaxID=3365530 RepID=UPI0037213267
MSEYAAELRELAASVLPEDGGTPTVGRAREVLAGVRELGLPRIGVPEERGGSGGTLDDLLVAVEALAARGAGVPLIESSVADWVIGHVRPLDEAFAVTALLDGAPGVVEAGSTLTGELAAVPWARDASLLLACGPGREPLIIDLRHDSVGLRASENLAGEPRDTVLLDHTPAVPVASGPRYPEIRARLALLWSAAVTGAAHGAYRLTKAYVSEREQFGAPLLRLPAVSSGLASMRVQLMQADAALGLAREAVAEPGWLDVASAVAVARVTTARTATEVARAAHQLHGAMGITGEYPLHHFTRRLWAWRDAVATEREWADTLGKRAADLGEDAVWTRLTASGS